MGTPEISETIILHREFRNQGGLGLRGGQERHGLPGYSGFW